jgi:large conductance mechanosensitive channel
MLKGFRDFILRGNVVDLAVAVVIGAAFGDVVKALTKGLLTPFIGVIGGLPDFSGFKWEVNGSEFLIGDFLNSFISFLLIASVIYFFVVVPMNKVLAQLKSGEKKEPMTKICPECLSIIPLKAKRCKFCTSIVKSK